MEVKKIYFDMDGVLADFDRGVREFCGMEPSPQGEGWYPGIDDPMWAKARQVPHYYDRLYPIPGALEMLRTVYEKYGERCEILTGIPKPKRGMIGAAEDKVKWMHRLFSEDIVVNTVFREQKPDYCTGRDCILVDDFQKNIEEWEQEGGTGIVHTTPENTLRILKEMKLL